MKSEGMIQDEFDVYFARAALDNNELAEQQQALDNRRGSVPNNPSFGDHLTVDQSSSACRRTASCKYPSTRRPRGSLSPRPGDSNGSRSPRRRSSAVPKDDTSSPPTRHTLQAPDVDHKCHSAPHSRSSSFKKMHRPSSSRDIKAMEDHVQRSTSSTSLNARRDSVPLEDAVSAKLEQLRLLQAENVCVVRNFSTSSKGIINRGDSFKRKKRGGAASPGNKASSADAARARTVSPKVVRVTPTPPPEAEVEPIPLTRLDTTPIIRKPKRMISTQHSRTSSTATPPLLVLVLGRHGVGKTAILQQFMTSEYMGAVETNFDDDCEKLVSVHLDGEETMIHFVDVPYDQDHRHHGQADGFLLVYSITDRDSFLFVQTMLQEIRHHDRDHAAVIVVANKSDLVRGRHVTVEEGKDACMRTDSKYIEVSGVLNHKVDDLLVGLVSQIRLNQDRKKRMADPPHMGAEAEKGSSCPSMAKGLLNRLFKKKTLASKSCDNLLIL